MKMVKNGEKKPQFESIFFAILRPFKATKQLLGYVRWLETCTKKWTKIKLGTIQVKILSQNGPKIDKNFEKKCESAFLDSLWEMYIQV